MLTYRARIRLSGGYVGKIQSDTLFGGLCWSYHGQADEHDFEELLSRISKGEPPFVTSDPFPGDFLPKPLLPPPNRMTETTDKKELVEIARRAKTLKDVRWLSMEELQSMLAGAEVAPALKERMEITRLTLHNTINRATNTTLVEGGGLYDLPETFSKSDYLTIYFRIAPDWVDAAQQCLVQLGRSGVGRRRSNGKGGFEVVSFEPFAAFDRADGNAYVSLSHFVPAPQDSQDGCFKTIVKYPRLDREYAQGPNPFKHPLMLMVPGSVFYSGENPKPFYGQAIGNIAPGLPSAIQGAFAFAAPFVWKRESV